MERNPKRPTLSLAQALAAAGSVPVALAFAAGVLWTGLTWWFAWIELVGAVMFGGISVWSLGRMAQGTQSAHANPPTSR